MKSSVATITALSLAASSTASHPNVAVLQKFSPHFRCPYANDWVNKGPVQAAVDLGLWNATVKAPTSSKSNDQLRRRAQELTATGSCTFTNVWTGQPACVELRGESWTTESMQTRCDSEEQGVLATGAACDLPPTGTGGWCIAATDNGVEASPLALVGMDCDQVKMTCETMVGGTFEPLDACEGSGGHNFPSGVPTGDAPNCAIAPGSIGAGHQAAYSSGYSPACEGTPAEGSPYMWPMAWSADLLAESMAYGSDEVVYTSKGNVHYRLDKNWKRADTWYTRGVQRGLGQAPCPPDQVDQLQSEGPILACRRDSDEHTTMIHRGSKMMFISWKNTTDAIGEVPTDPTLIESCDWLDLAVVGNIRPDWYMDDRGDSTDVQYMGDQHIYHNEKPRLVKQWRKKDFASQYFTMSILGNTKDDAIHWPMVLNVPGEGFGDDFLQKYSNHSLLTDDDDSLFLLDEALEAIGGMCTNIGGGGGGPPAATEEVLIPSNLEVDSNSWYSNVYTYSPVWQPPMKQTENVETTETGKAITEKGSVIVTSCYDAAAKAVDISVEFLRVAKEDGSELPWMAMGYRETEECRMNPADGGDSEMILLTADAEDTEAYYTVLPSAARGFNADAISSISDNMSPLNEKEGFTGVDLHLPNPTSSMARSGHMGSETSVVLHFKQSMGTVPEVMHLMYAIGSSSQVGFHLSRECFDVTEFPTCPTTGSSSSSKRESSATEATSTEEEVGSVPFMQDEEESNDKNFFIGILCVVVVFGSITIALVGILLSKVNTMMAVNPTNGPVNSDSKRTDESPVENKPTKQASTVELTLRDVDDADC